MSQRFVQVYLSGEATAQPRAKVATFGGHVRMYTPKKADQAKTDLGVAFRAELAKEGALTDEQFNGPVEVAVSVNRAYPKSMAKKRRIPGSPVLTKPDGDNYVKLVLDALTRAGAYHDDSQVWHLSCSKTYLAQPGLSVIIAYGTRGVML